MSVDFSKLNKLAAKSFNNQKALIKKVLMGRPVNCPDCQTEIKLVSAESGQLEVRCAKGCTSILLDAD